MESKVIKNPIRIMNNQHQVVQAPFCFRLLSSKFKDWTQKVVNKGDSLVVLKELSLTPSDAASQAAAAHATFTTLGTSAALAAARVIQNDVEYLSVVDVDDSTHAYWKIHDQAKEEFAATGKIKGFEVLNLQTIDKLWLSHFDMEFLINKHEQHQ